MSSHPTPDLDTLWHTALTHDGAGRWAEAEQAYRSLLALRADFHPAWHALGILAVNLDRLAIAAGLIEQALSIDESQGLYWRNLGEVRRRLGRLPGAVEAAGMATRLLPDDPQAWYNLGLARAEAGQPSDAEQAYRQALSLAPTYGPAWNNLGSLLQQRGGPGDLTAARAAYERAVALHPEHAEAQNNLGALHAEQGRLAPARACFEAAIEARGDFVEAHYNYSSLHTYPADDPHLSLLQNLYATREQLPVAQRLRYCFALGKAWDDAGDVDRAFAAYAEGNRLQHGLLGYDEAREAALAQRVMAVFDSDFMARRRDWQGARDPARTPIFIVGMPRSGTTLIEQILCTHPAVHGAGELPLLSQAIAAGVEAGPPYPEGIHYLDEAGLRAMGERYLREVWQLAPDSRFISDKMPANFFYLGLIHLALPEARIIHALRDPMDACFSCYARLFNETMAFAYDQHTLGRYYTRYRQLMQHWHQVLPAGTVLDLSYEALVADPEGQARRLLAFVGLPWDPACLDFHGNARSVKTASVAQVRRPIYRTSVARWLAFAEHLSPLYEQVAGWRDTTADDPRLGVRMRRARVDSLHREGVAHYHAGEFAGAVALFDQALALAPDIATLHNSRGFALQDLGEIEAARDSFAHAVGLAPEDAMARLNLGLAQLKLGDWQPGWHNYESRWAGAAEVGAGDFQRPACPLPQWTGQEGVGQALLVIVEQGYGDTFQFGRYLALLGERFERVGLACSGPLLRLMQDSFGEQVVVLADLPEDFSGWDWHCPLMSLPRAFATTLANVPCQVPYLRAPGPARGYWAARLQKAAPRGLRIGLAWAGRPGYRYNDRRSLAFEHVTALLSLSATDAGQPLSWISLQKWLPADGAPQVAPGVDWIDWTSELSDFAATAALVANLDLVISVDSAIVHLAGGLDVPVWMLDRLDNEWRWLKDRLDSPWYPRLRIFRQARFGDWTSPLKAARTALASLPVARR
jgi:tetratricopeptide (TPR) repeat protein